MFNDNLFNFNSIILTEAASLFSNVVFTQKNDNGDYDESMSAYSPWLTTISFPIHYTITEFYRG